MPDWSGKVAGSLENGQATGLQLKQGDVISVLATGWIKFGPNDTQWAAPQSPIPTNKSDYDRNPALVARFGTGKKTYPIGNAVPHWPVPEDGELILQFVDAPGTYGDNSGWFEVAVTKE